MLGLRCGRDLRRLRMIFGDCRDVLLDEFDENSIDACVTDPPYHLTSIVKRFGATNAAPAKSNGPTGVYGRASAGFMGQRWDGGDISFRPETWREVWRVLKPGAHMLVFGGTRTYHRMACAVEDAGFDVRDAILWIYGSGFPKSHNVSKDIDRAAGVKRKVIGRNPNWRDPDANAEHHARWNNAVVTGDLSLPVTDAAKQWNGWGTALKPAAEIICVARKPLSERTVADNVLRWGTAAINIDECRVSSGPDHEEKCRSVVGLSGPRTRIVYNDRLQHPREDSYSSLGRWPANVVHDSSAEVVEAFNQFGRRQGFSGGGRREGLISDRHVFLGLGNGGDVDYYGDNGSVSRFFYCAKADKDDRRGINHPTVKPIDLLRWLTRLITPPGGTVLDPFAGSGTTVEAAYLEGFKAVGIENESKWYTSCCQRLGLNIERLRL